MKYFLISIITLLFITSCTEIIDINDELPNDLPRVAVVEAMISTDTMAHLVRLSWTKDLDNDQAPDAISDAQITISGNGSEVLLTEDQNEPGSYYTPSDYYVVANKRYYLTIDNVDTNDDGEVDLITATDSVPTRPVLDSIEIEWIEQWEGWSVNAFAQEDGSETNFYMFKALINDVFVTDTLSEWQITDDELFNGQPINGLQTNFFQSEREDEFLNDGDKVTVEISGLSEEAALFLLDAQDESGYSAPLFSGPPSNVEGNLRGENVFGAFITYSSNKASTFWSDNDYKNQK
jgi:hypothetical protein